MPQFHAGGRNRNCIAAAILEKPALEGCIVTTDSTGRRRKTAGQAVNKKADYLFSLKGNQETLYQDVQEYFDEPDISAPQGKNRHIQFHSVSTQDEKHGRIEDRDYAVSEYVGWLVEGYSEWKSIRSIGVVESSREAKGETTVERPLFISSMAGMRKHSPGRYVDIGGYTALAMKITIGPIEKNHCCPV
jgi:predicted transposase YbfD/YdcC